MEISKSVKFSFNVLATLWVVFLVECIPFLHLERFGIVPRTVRGLWGIPLSPLLHGNIGHLMANSGTLFVLLSAIFALYEKLAAGTLFLIVFAGGAFVWLFGEAHTNVIGASGVIFGLMGFLFTLGIFQKSIKTVAISVIMFVIYGVTMIQLAMIVPGVSWAGHFWGFVSGVLAAYVAPKKAPKSLSERFQELKSGIASFFAFKKRQ